MVRTVQGAVSPVLEKVAAEYAEKNKGVLLVKLDVDEEQFIAAQFQVRSIPTVICDLSGAARRRPDPARQRKSDSSRCSTSCSTSSRSPAPARSSEPTLAQLLAMAEASPGRRRCRARCVDLCPDRRDGTRRRGSSGRALSAALLTEGKSDEARAAFDTLPDALRADPC